MNSGADNPFWRWSLERYSRKPVERALLKLQDECGFDVNMALWCCWRAQVGADVDEEDINAAIEAKRAWTANVVHPLRAARRYLKSIDKGTDKDTARLREHIKAAELDAEKHVQNLLFQIAPPAPAKTVENPGEAALRHLGLYARLLDAEKNPAFSKDLLRDLVSNIFGAAQELPHHGNGERRSSPPGSDDD